MKGTDPLGECETRLARVEGELREAKLFAEIVKDVAGNTFGIDHVDRLRATAWLESYAKLAIPKERK